MARRGPQGGPPLADQVETQQRRNEALAMRLAGKSNLDIAAHFNVHPGTASRYVTTALKDIPRENAEEYRQRQLLAIDEMWAGIWKDATHGDTWKIDRMLALMERQAKLLGLDKLAEIEALKTAHGDAGAEAASMMSTLMEGLQAVYIGQKQREKATEESDDDELDE